MKDLIERQAAIDSQCSRCCGYNRCDVFPCDEVLALQQVQSAQPKWNNHTVACLLAELYGDTCACNYSDIDEWLPEKCELLDSCPHPAGVACWEQFLKHRAERNQDANND